MTCDRDVLIIERKACPSNKQTFQIQKLICVIYMLIDYFHGQNAQVINRFQGEA